MQPFKQTVARLLVSTLAGISIATPCAAKAQPVSDREIRRDVQWIYDNGARLLVSLADGRQLIGIVTAIADDTFEIEGESATVGSVRMVYRVVENPQVKSQSNHSGFSEKWLWIGSLRM